MCKFLSHPVRYRFFLLHAVEEANGGEQLPAAESCESLLVRMDQELAALVQKGTGWTFLPSGLNNFNILGQDCG